MLKEYVFNSGMNGKCKLIVNDDKIIINRVGFFSKMNFPFNKSKTILINQISGTQYNPSSVINPTGYLQFIIIGSQHSKSEFKKTSLKEINSELNRIRKDENSIVWIGKKGNTYAEEIINYINTFSQSEKSTNDDKYEQLKKLKLLLDDGIISEEEFQSEKQKLLND